jgi:Polysaccharide lyase
MRYSEIPAAIRMNVQPRLVEQLTSHHHVMHALAAFMAACHEAEGEVTAMNRRKLVGCTMYCTCASENSKSAASPPITSNHFQSLGVLREVDRTLWRPTGRSTKSTVKFAMLCLGLSINAPAFATTISAATVAAPIIGVVSPYSAWVNHQSTFNVSNGGSTYSNLLVIQGSGPPGATITVFDNGNSLGQSTGDENGNWCFVTGSVQGNTSLIPVDGAHSFSAKAAINGSTSAASAEYSVITKPVMSNFSQTPDSTFGLDQYTVFNQSAGQPWSIASLGASHDIRLELRRGDEWENDYSTSTEQRTEISTSNRFAYQQVADLTFEWMMEEGNTTPGGWGVLFWQAYQGSTPTGGANTSPPLSMFLNDSGHLVIEVAGTPELSTTTPFQKVFNYQGSQWGNQIDPEPVQLGHWYSFHVRFRYSTDSSGFVTVWRDGQQILNYCGNIGITTYDSWFNLDIYRHIAPDTTTTHTRNWQMLWPGP